jgi:AAA family ATP:ADP antiporter
VPLPSISSGLLRLAPGEGRPVVLGALYFFLLLASYYLLRPVRDEMGIRAGVDQLQWLFTATFVVMLAVVPLFGWASSRWPRRQLIPAVYLFFIAGLVLFYWLLQVLGGIWVARAFYVWVSVYNLFVVSVFWSLMTDLFSQQQGKRLFGIIAAGGSAGAIVGPGLAALLAQTLGPHQLLPVSGLLLGGALWCALLLTRTQSAAQQHAPALGGGIWEGIEQLARQRRLQGIALFIWLYTTLATFLYFQQAHIVAEAFSSSADRTTTFALIDLGVNALTVLLQLFVTGRLLQGFGLGRSLALVPALLAVGFAALAIAPVLAVLAAVQITRRAGNYGITRPAREVLYTGVERSARYKAKNFIDTVVYRGGDALAGWLYTGLKTAGLGLGGIALLSIPLALGWAALGLWLGKTCEEEKDEQHPL